MSAGSGSVTRHADHFYTSERKVAPAASVMGGYLVGERDQPEVFARVAQPEEARRRERRQCRCEPCHEHQPSLVELRPGETIFGLQALK